MLTTSLLALFLGPLLYQLIARNKGIVAGIDGFVSVSIAGLLLFHALHHESSAQGLPLFIAFVLGLVGPLIFERCFRGLQRNIHYLALALALVGFFAHAAADGFALGIAALGNSTLGETLPLAIIVHRLPVGLAVWWLLKPRFGIAVALSILLVTGGATVIGFLLAEEPSMMIESYPLDLFQAFVAGSILHVVFFPFHLDHGHGEGGSCCEEDHANHKSESETKPFSLAPESLGNLLGILFLSILLLFPSLAEHHHEAESALSGDAILTNFLSLSLQSAPALFIAYLSGVLIYGFAPQGSFDWLGRGGRLMQSAKGVAVGLPLPVCSCGVLPYYETLVRKGVPPAAAIAFLVATPELGLDAILISFPLLGTEITIIRLVAAALLAFVAAYVMGGVLSRQKPGLEVLNSPPSQSRVEKLKAGAKHGLVDLVDTTAPWILLGLALAAVSAPLLSQVQMGLSPVLEVMVFSLLGLVVYVCASGATPLVAAFIAGGIGVGAGLAFLLTGPATNISTFGVLRSLHGLKGALIFSGLMFGLAVLVGVTVNLSFPELTVPDHFGKHHHEALEASILQWVSLALVGTLILFSFLRQGGRKFFSHITVG